jgi:hypothetical protein
MLPDPKETSDTIKFLKKSIKKTWLARVWYYILYPKLFIIETV